MKNHHIDQLLEDILADTDSAAWRRQSLASAVKAAGQRRRVRRVKFSLALLGLVSVFLLGYEFGFNSTFYRNHEPIPEMAQHLSPPLIEGVTIIQSASHQARIITSQELACRVIRSRSTPAGLRYVTDAELLDLAGPSAYLVHFQGQKARLLPVEQDDDRIDAQEKIIGF